MKNSWCHFWKAHDWKGQLCTEGFRFSMQSYMEAEGSLEFSSWHISGHCIWLVLQNAEVTLTWHYDSFEWKQVFLTCSLLNSVLFCSSQACKHNYLTGFIKHSSGTFTTKILRHPWFPKKLWFQFSPWILQAFTRTPKNAFFCFVLKKMFWKKKRTESIWKKYHEEV